MTRFRDRCIARPACPSPARCEPADPGHDRGDGIRPLSGRHGGAEPDQGVAAGIALSVPRPATPTATSTLTTGSSRRHCSLEQADLDQSHGPGRIAIRAPRRLAAMTSGTTATDLESTRSAVRSRRTSRRTSPTWRSSSRSTVAPTRPMASTRWAAGPPASCPIWGQRSTSGPIRVAGSGTRSWRRSTAWPMARRVLLIGHMDTVFDPGTAAERPFRIDDGNAHGPGVTDMKSGLLAGLYALKSILGQLGRPALRAPDLHRQLDEEIGSPSSVDHIREAAGTSMSAGPECARANGDIVLARKGIPYALYRARSRGPRGRGPRPAATTRRRLAAMARLPRRTAPVRPAASFRRGAGRRPMAVTIRSFSPVERRP